MAKDPHSTLFILSSAGSPFLVTTNSPRHGDRGEGRGCCLGNYQRRFFVHLIATLNYREKYRSGKEIKVVVP